MKRVYVCLAFALMAGMGLVFADVGHFTETLPPAVSAGAVPVSNGYDWTLSTLSTAPASSFKNLTVTTFTVTSALTASSSTVQLIPLSAAQVLTTTATLIGQAIWCKDCAANGGKGTVCFSTSSTGAQNGFVLSTGTACL